MKKPAFLKGVKRIHFTGLKGVGMTALACCARDLKIKVGGSDVAEVFVTDKVLKQQKIPWKIGFSADHLRPRPDLVITTGAHGGLSNPEVLAAGEQKIPVLTQGQALGKLMEGKEGIAVCGVGGKSTIAAMMATVLSFGRRYPSYAVGVATINPLGPGGKYDKGREFVAEADEYANSPGVDNRPKFSFQKPKMIVATNIEYDHPDIYRDFNQTKKIFADFLADLPKDGLLVACADNQNTWETVRGLGPNLQTYGFSSRADWQISKSFFGQGQTIFSLAYQGVIIDEIRIKVPGRFNILNATAVFAVATWLGLDAKTIKMGLLHFGGTRRRFEFIGEVNQIKLYDDYGHHPHEIKEVLLAAKKWFPQNRLLVIFQPHTYSRTKALFHDFAQAFNLADWVAVADIYSSARETETLGINSALLVQEIQKYHPKAVYQPNETQVVDFVARQTLPGDIVLTLGAGSIFQWHQSILKALRA